jgi:hypothetical protein
MLLNQEFAKFNTEAVLQAILCDIPLQTRNLPKVRPRRYCQLSCAICGWQHRVDWNVNETLSSFPTLFSGVASFLLLFFFFMSFETNTAEKLRETLFQA